MTATPPPPSPPLHRDWTQYLYPGPRRVFSEAEMAAVGQDALPREIERYALINLGIALLMLLALLPGLRWLQSAPLIVLLVLSVVMAARQVWQRPTRQRLNLWTFGIAFTIGLGLGILSKLVDDRQSAETLAVVVLVALSTCLSAVWFLAIYRVQQLETRLAERAARADQDRLQRRLATAQIHPHFVFNTLASLTHWVDTQDARAAPLLREFNAYLRATLPMFERESQPLREELDLVRHYLAIMQARLGDRLRWSVEGELPAELALPPGSLLTLAENAITHGIEPSLRGGVVTVRGERAAGGWRLIVEDSGEGLVEPVTEGLGLKNTRERLLALHPQARLQLAALPTGGCIATMEIPA